ncbi:uncharacterized protein LOC132713348 isoform X2 [Ruditapes philippinarum]|uniref:uncharacterized protein LOC132713348 isoform X2 n=1 Tax=Ruditapes philippinarum TaxID=129788 RepID=UPI00295B09F6|nr:uncharacterized protein LOC132713348 isoform X2 [Ruditapes philippinarum]
MLQKPLRQAVSNNKLKSELPSAEGLQVKTSENLTDEVASHNEQEKMDCESLASGRLNGGTDNNLPLKKRRLIGMNNESLTTSDLNFGSSANLDTLASARQIENILQMAKDYPASSADSALSLVTSLTQTKLQEGAGYRPVQFDPRTSLMVLSDLKFALTPDEDGDLPIHIAVVHENIDLVKKFIDIMAVSGKTVDRFNKLQQTPLHLAVLVKRPEIVSALLIAGANPNLLDRHGYTSVHISVQKQQPECMETVFRDSKFPVKLNTRDYEGYYPLHTCVELDNLKMMVALIKKGADMDCQDGKAGRSVLLYAVEYNRLSIVHYLLEHGATPDLQNYASVTPMMTAQAANQDEIITWLNKALDIGTKYEDSYIPSKKLPIARIPAKGFQPGTKDRVGRHSVSGDMPLIYEEYNPGSRSQTVSDTIKKEPLSRQSSVSSPIDLSMRHNTESPSQPPNPPNEMSIRGKPGRRKTKKEHKNHKEKQPQKSMVKEKHASVVAALEGSMFAGQTYPRKGNDKVSDDKPFTQNIKIEAQDSEDIEMKCKTENGGMADAENAKSNLSSTTLSDFILNLKPDQTKYLVEKVRQQLNVHKDHISTLSSKEPSKYAAETDCDNKTDYRQNSPENVPERMHQDLKSDDSKNDTPVTETVLKDKGKYLGKIVSLKDNCVIDDIEMDVESSNEKEAAENVTGPTESQLVGSRCESRSDTPEAYASDESDIEDISMDCSHVAVEAYNVQQTAGSSPGKIESHSDSNIIGGQVSVSVNDKNDIDKADKPVHGVNVHENLKNYLKERIVNRSENSQKTARLYDRHDKPSKTVELVSQISQESGSSSSLQGSQGSHGFEVISPPVLNVNQANDLNVFKKVSSQAEHSEDSMEVEFPSEHQVSDQKESSHKTAVDDDESDVEKVYSKDDAIHTNGDGESMEVNLDEEKLKANIDTDDDDEETGLVIDEHVENESENNGDTFEVNDNIASEDKNIKTDQGKDEDSEMTNMDVKDSGYSETCEEAIENNRTDYVQPHNKECNGEIDEENEQDRSEKGVNDEVHVHSEKSSEVNGTDFSNGASVRNVESPSFIRPDGIKPYVKQNAQELKEKDIKKKAVGEGGLSQSLSQEEMLKKGQSHTLFYRDGDGYKPIKIFIDNSKQSSLVLQKMFQSAQLANVNRKSGLAGIGDIKKTPAENSNISDLSKLVTMKSSGTNVITSQTIPVTNSSLAENNITGKVSENSLNTAAITSSYMNIVTSSNMNVESISVTSTNHSGLASTTSVTDSNQSFQQAYIESLKQKASAELAVINNSGSVKQTKKRTTLSPSKSDTSSHIKAVSQSAKLKISHSAKSFDSQPFIEMLPPCKKVHVVPAKPLNVNIASKHTSEGTLTRVNPDIRRNVKALLSQRKVGLVRSESDSYIVSNKGINSNVVTTVPETVQTSVTDSRQQL